MRRVLLALSTAVALVAALLSLTGTAAGAADSATLGVDVQGPAEFSLPDTNGNAADITYTVDVTSPALSVPVTLTDTTSGGTVVGISGPSAGDCSVSGNTVTCSLLVTALTPASIEVHVDAPDAAGTVTNDAVADPQLLGVTGGSDSASTDVAAPADLAVVISGTPGTIEPEQGVLYTVTATNNGPNPVSELVIADTTPTGTIDAANSALPAGCTFDDSDSDGNDDSVSCEFADVASGASRTIQVAVFAPASAVVTSMTSTATVDDGSGATSDPTPGNDSASATTTIDPDAGTGVVRPGECTDADGHELCVDENGNTVIVTAMNDQAIDPDSQCGAQSCPDSALFLDFSTDENYQGEIVLDLRYGTPPPPCRGLGKPCAEPYISKDGGQTYDRIPSCTETGGGTPCYVEIYKEADGTWHFVIRLHTEDPLIPILGV